MKIILASHSKLAEGMKASAEFFGLRGISVIEQTMDDTNFPKRAMDLLDSISDECIIVFTDIMGGSVNQIFTALLKKYNFFLIAGMNLPMVLELGYAGEVDEDTIRNCVENSKGQIAYINDYIANLNDDEEED